MLRGKNAQIVQTRHGPVRLDDLANNRRRRQTGVQRQIDSRLGMTGAAQYPACSGEQRKNMPRSVKIRRRGLRIGQQFSGDRPVRRGNTGRDAVLTRRVD